MAGFYTGFLGQGLQNATAGDYLSGALSAIGNEFSNPISGLSSLGNWLTTPTGTGENAASPFQLGLMGLGLWQQQNNFEDQLEEARKQFNFQKGVTQGNFLNNGANFLNQGLFQLESLNAFNPTAGAERAANLNAAVNTMNQAASKLQLGDTAFAEQQNALQKYNSLLGK